MKHRASPRFWGFYAELPAAVQRIADGNYELLKTDPQHPSLHFWIGHHSEYDRK